MFDLIAAFIGAFGSLLLAIPPIRELRDRRRRDELQAAKARLKEGKSLGDLMDPMMLNLILAGSGASRLMLLGGAGLLLVSFGMTAVSAYWKYTEPPAAVAPARTPG
jgi:hypothetical protein